MSSVAIVEPRLLHAMPGRMRVHLPGWSGHDSRAIETQLRQFQGVQGAQANPLTGNVLIRFDAAATDAKALLAAVRAPLQTLLQHATGASEAVISTQAVPEGERPQAPLRPSVLSEGQRANDDTARARIAVPGLERDPELARRVVQRLQSRPEVVRASASLLTGRVLVEWNRHKIQIEDLVDEIFDLGLPDLPDESLPAHPLDPAPLVQSATRTVGASLGLGMLGARRLLGIQKPPVTSLLPVEAAGLLGILQSFPAVRNGLRELLGPHAADVLFSAAGIISLTLAGSPLGLVIGGLEALRLFTETRARQAAWRLYEERLDNASSAQPGAIIRLDTGETTPLGATVLEGFGTATGRDALPHAVQPGHILSPGARLHGGPFVLELHAGEPFVPVPRPVPLVEPLQDRYLNGVGLLSLACATLTAVVTRSFARTFEALLLVNARPAAIGVEAADKGASARVLRSGVTVIGTRPERAIRLPGALLLDSPRLLTQGLEVAAVLPLGDGDSATILAQAAAVSAAAGAPWGGTFPIVGIAAATDGAFDGKVASAEIDGARFSLGPVKVASIPSEAARLREDGDYLLLLRGQSAEPLAVIALRPRLADSVEELVATCARHGVEITLLSRGDAIVARAVAQRAKVLLLRVDRADDAVASIRARQEQGAPVAFVADNARAAAAFAACDLAIGFTKGHSRLPARADLLAPDLSALTAIIETGAQRQATVRDSVGLSMLANVAGVIWGLRGGPGIRRASLAVNIAALGALAAGAMRLRGGRAASVLSHIVDPHPERWGRRDTASVLRALDTTEEGLSSGEAARRRRATTPATARDGLWSTIFEQLRAPLTLILAVGAGLSLSLGSTADAAMIGAMLVANAAAGAWQEQQAGEAVEALQRMGAATSRVLRDRQIVTVSANEVVPGDVLLLAPGGRVVADARLLEVNGLEVDEASLTGESLPVVKAPDAASDAARIVLEGSDVSVGTGRAVVVAVGRNTRMGAIAAALALDEAQGQGPLTGRLNELLKQFLPIAAAGGVLVAASGLLRRQPFVPQLAIGASIAVAAVPEGLPLLARVGEAGVARRLAGRRALVRRLSAVEALGQVDIACTDKTGTLTEGRLRLRLVADIEHESGLPDLLGANLEAADLRHVLLTATLAGPHPDAADAAADLTDVVVSEAAQSAGLGEPMRAEREAESPFNAALSFHATVVGGRLCVEGAAEALVPRCDRVRRNSDEVLLDEAGREELLVRARHLAERGLRVLMVAEGAPNASDAADDPQRLVALGFLGISDPLRQGVPEAVRRCHDAGVRVMMITGDHPATARAIARDAGLPGDDGQVLTGADIAGLPDGELDQRLERVTVIARATPLDKLRIVESLQRRGHTVAMTGDGVNDAPALRLAKVGVAMGRGGTEVARQTADVVLTDDDFSTLVEALVEGRSFWRNIRRALGLLLGGNLGELGLEVGAAALGLASPLTTRQILTVNLITDVLPALAVALQQPAHRELAALSREGASALEAPLRREVLRRGTATALPSLGTYLIALRLGTLPQARTVAFASIIATQLAQTLDVGRAEDGLSHSVLGAVAGSAAMLAAALTVPPLRLFLGLAMPTPLGWTLVAGGTVAALLRGRARSSI